MAVFEFGGTAERIELLSRASDLLKKHSGNLHDLIRDLPRAVDFLVIESTLTNLDDEMRAFDDEFEAVKPRLAALADILDRYAFTLECEYNKLLNLPPELPPHCDME